MRLRLERKLRKRLRNLHNSKPEYELSKLVQKYEVQGLSLAQALQTILLDRSPGWFIRGEAARVLAIAEGPSIADYLLQQFFSQTEKTELWEIALTLERFGDVRSVGPLTRAIHDANHHRRHAAVRALGWIPDGGNRAVSALINALTDLSQPSTVRVEAAESLAYQDSARAIPTLINALLDPDVRIRFWSVFALGSIRHRKTGRHTDRSVIPALMAMLDDHAIPSGWWSVAREALAMLGQLDPAEPTYRDRLAEEIQRVLADPHASPEDRRWAEGYA